ncbi:MAG: hypothetical protein ABI478_15490 [Propionivibrio sp.]
MGEALGELDEFYEKAVIEAVRIGQRATTTQRQRASEMLQHTLLSWPARLVRRLAGLIDCRPFAGDDRSYASDTKVNRFAVVATAVVCFGVRIRLHHLAMGVISQGARSNVAKVFDKAADLEDVVMGL